MPPCAIGPTTSYWSATRSPGTSRGRSENGVPHLGQKPSRSAGCPAYAVPTGVRQASQTPLTVMVSRSASTRVDGSAKLRIGIVTTRAMVQVVLVADAWDGAGAGLPTVGL